MPPRFRVAVVLCRVLSALLILIPLLPAWLFALIASGGKWEEGERLNLFDLLITSFIPLTELLGLILAFWKPRIAIFVLLLAPLLLIETPVMYGRPSPLYPSLIAAAAILHIIAWQIGKAGRRRRPMTSSAE